MATIGLTLLASLSLRAQMSDESNPYLAAVSVYTEARYYEALRDYCANEDPSSTASLSAAIKAWMERHSALYEKSLLILRSGYTTEEFAQLAKSVHESSEEATLRIASAEPAERLSRCRALPRQISSPAMSPLNRPKLVAAIEGFR